MRVVFNCGSNLAVGSSRVSVYNMYDEFKEMPDITAKFRDFGNYDKYDCAILHGSVEEVSNARRQNQDITIGLTKAHTHTKSHIDATRKADFLIADSESSREFLLKFNKNVVTIPLVEKMPEVTTSYTEGQDEFVLAYHGNKNHLNSFTPEIKNALERLSEYYNIKLRAIYDIDSLGKWEAGKPNIPIKHIQHSNSKDLSRIHKELSEAHAGLVPAGRSLPYEIQDEIRNYTSEYCAGANPHDVITRFKHNANAGRAYVFMQLGIPVVATPLAELRSIINERENGLTARSEEGWIDAISYLIENPEKRKRIGLSGRSMMEKQYTTEKSAKILKNYIKKCNTGELHTFPVENSRFEEVYQNKPSKMYYLLANNRRKLLSEILPEKLKKTAKMLLRRI